MHDSTYTVSITLTISWVFGDHNSCHSWVYDYRLPCGRQQAKEILNILQNIIIEDGNIHSLPEDLGRKGEEALCSSIIFWCYRQGESKDQ